MLFQEEMDYPAKGEKRRLHVWLPDSYDRSEERYPVLYFFDGHNLFRDEDATYGTSWHMAEFLKQYPRQMIVIGMEPCLKSGSERLGEYSPYTFDNDYWGHVRAYGKETLDWIVREVKPVVDRELRTWPQREATALGGSSMGGLMSLYAGCCCNETFSKLACISSSLDFSYPELLQDVERAAPDPDTRFFLSWGDREGGDGEDFSEELMKQRNEQIGEILRRKGSLVRLYEQKNGHHCEADWRRQIGLFMDFLW